MIAKTATSSDTMLNFASGGGWGQISVSRKLRTPYVFFSPGAGSNLNMNMAILWWVLQHYSQSNLYIV